MYGHILPLNMYNINLHNIVNTSQFDQCQTASEEVASVDLLRAIRWASQGWDTLQPITISKCFRKAGVLTSSMSTV